MFKITDKDFHEGPVMADTATSFHQKSRLSYGRLVINTAPSHPAAAYSWTRPRADELYRVPFFHLYDSGEYQAARKGVNVIFSRPLEV